MGEFRLRKLIAVAFFAVPFLTNHASAQDFVWLSGSGAFTEEARDRFYRQDQGSSMIPYAWFKALRRADGQSFLADGLARYGYLANPKQKDGLPVGFTLLEASGPLVVGMTCAACHTRQINVEDKAYRIDGGPAIADFQSLLTDLDASVTATLNDPAKFAAFAAEVKAIDPTTDASGLKAAVTDWREKYHAIVFASITGAPNHAAWGFGRLDAISMIFDRVTGLEIGSTPTRIVAGNMNPAGAPARYPFLWDAATENKTQWPGFAPNGALGPALARNVGEVFGVFARFEPQSPAFAVQSFNVSSVNFAGMQFLEDTAADIPAPKWPWPVNAEKQKRGAQIFTDTCATCHGSATGSRIFQRDTPVQDVCTDGAEDLLLGRRIVSAGVLRGAPTPDLKFPPQLLDDKSTDVDVLKVAVIGAIVQHFTHPDVDNFVGELTNFDLTSPAIQSGSHAELNLALKKNAADLRIAPAGAGLLTALDTAHRKLSPDLRDLMSAYAVPAVQTIAATGGNQCSRPQSAHAAYEARYLSGVWAVAPYLHDGSVPTLWDLLQTPDKRKPTFKIGPNYDLDKVGLADAQPDGQFSTLATTDCSAINSGRSRCGHVYGVDLSDDDKRALIEYLKTY